MCISRATLKKYSKHITELDYLSAYLHLNWTGHSEESSASSIDTGDRELPVPLDPASLVELGNYKRSITSHCTVLLELAEIHFDGA